MNDAFASPPTAPLTAAAPLGRPSVAAQALGLAGLLPFVAGAALPWLMQPGWRMLAASALLTYAALIVSFLGGIHWGLAMRQPYPSKAQLVWGVMPSLLGWLAVLLDTPWGLLLMAVSLVACYGVDRYAYPRHGAAAWLGLRAVLTGVAVLCCLSGWAAVYYL